MELGSSVDFINALQSEMDLKFSEQYWLTTERICTMRNIWFINVYSFSLTMEIGELYNK